jgi:hypothetical protein
MPRIQALSVQGAGLQPLVLGALDTQLGFACDFRLASDGKLRCLPQAPYSGVFLDESCQRRVFWGLSDRRRQLLAEPSAPKYVAAQVEGRSACDEAVRYEVHSIEPVREDAYYVRQADRCVRISVDPTDQHYVSTGVVNPATLAEAEPMLLERSANFSMRAARTSDGTIFELGLHSLELNVGCSLDAHVCLPEVAMVVRGFSDANCQAPLPLLARATCPSTRWARFDDGPKVWLQPLGAAYTGSRFELYSATSCLPSQDPSTLYAVEPGVQPAPTVAFATQDVDRLSLQGISDGSVWLQGLYFSHENLVCSPTLSETAGIRCVPPTDRGEKSTREFVDAGCQQPALIRQAKAPCGLLLDPGSTLPGYRALVQLKAADALYTWVEEAGVRSCQALPSPSGACVRGAELDWNSLPELKLGIAGVIESR